MRIAVSCDHAGLPLKATVLQTICEAGHEAIDLGTNSTESVDIQDFAEKAARAVQHGEADRAISICGSGVGACISANKVKGVYASVCHDTYSAHQGVEHDNMNMLCLGARIIGVELAREIVLAFLGAQFNGLDRFVRRFGKIQKIESNG
jgi:RpiB/LacA/LacB family sugar-phosphate isomerase